MRAHLSLLFSLDKIRKWHLVVSIDADDCDVHAFLENLYPEKISRQNKAYNL